MRKFARQLLIAAVALSLIAVVALLVVYRALARVPEFYRQALAADGQAQYDCGQRFEQQALALHNQVHHVGRFEVRFSANEINGWLATELPKKFPQALPAGVGAPRIAFGQDMVRLALRYQRSGMDTVISLAGQAHLTDQPNEVAIYVEQVRAGALPVPLAGFLDEITERAARANLPLRWAEAKGTPVALIRIPLEFDGNPPHRLVLERLAVDQGNALVVAGRTEEPLPEQGADESQSTAVQSAASETRQR